MEALNLSPSRGDSPPHRKLDPIREEIANTITHGIGFLLSIVGIITLAVSAAPGDGLGMMSCMIYGGTLVSLYGASTVYHGLTCPRKKAVMRVADHICIYLLIAGTYTPISVIALRETWGWALFGVIWGLAIVGSILKLFTMNRADTFAAMLYIGMGWLALIAVKPIYHALPAGGLALIVAGGLFYTLGVYFFLKDEKIPYYHAIWHLFVMAGSACHFFAVLFYVLPRALG